MTARWGGMRRLALATVVCLAVLAAGAALAHGERTQQGDLIVTLDGELSPLLLPRGERAPVSVHLSGNVDTTDETELPRMSQVELGLPGQGTIFTRGLPVCSGRSIRYSRPGRAMAICGEALIGHGDLEAEVLLPTQAPFMIHAELLAFNGRRHGRRIVYLYGFSPSPPTVVVLPFWFTRREGRFGSTLVAHLPFALGPWPHVAGFDITLGRRYQYRGKQRSYLNASCPIPHKFTAGFFPFARSLFTFTDGRQVGATITRGCRAS